LSTALAEKIAIESKQLASVAAWLSDEKKAENIRVYCVSDVLKLADYFVVVTGLNRPHVKAILQELHVRLKAAGEQHTRTEGGDDCWWVLLDYGDVVVHILQQEAREYYDLDRLYQECPELDWTKVERPDVPPAPVKRAPSFD